MKLSSYTDPDSTRRYFKNRLGGLGQYYAGTLAQLELMDPSSTPWIKFTIERGQPLAQAVDKSIPGDQFWSVVQSDLVTLENLDALSSFCACSIRHSIAEHEALTDIFFDRSHLYGAMGVQRRHSLTLILHLAQALHQAGEIDLTEQCFRAAVYSGMLPSKQSWTVPISLHATRDAWTLYERNDLVSVVMQSVFVICLNAMQTLGTVTNIDRSNVEAFAASLAKSEGVEGVCASLGASSYGELLELLRSAGPNLSDWEDANHEIQLIDALSDGVKNEGDLIGLIELVLRAITLIEIRAERNSNPYGVLQIGEDELADSPINLASLRLRCTRWRELPLQEVVEDLFAWCLNTHLRVALRKLRHSGQSTFRFRPTERGLQVVDFIPQPSRTGPRFRQAVQILRDIGALTRDTKIAHKPTMLSAGGLMLLETYLG